MPDMILDGEVVNVTTYKNRDKDNEVIFYDKEAEGAEANGMHVVFVGEQEEGGTHIDGDEGYIRGSMGPMVSDKHPEHAGHYFYFVEWDDTPGVTIGIEECKIEEIGE